MQLLRKLDKVSCRSHSPQLLLEYKLQGEPRPVWCTQFPHCRKPEFPHAMVLAYQSILNELIIVVTRCSAKLHNTLLNIVSHQ